MALIVMRKRCLPGRPWAWRQECHIVGVSRWWCAAWRAIVSRVTRKIWKQASLVVAALPAAPPQGPPVTWARRASGVTVRLRGVSAVSSTVAWASGAGGTVLRTTDGGRTWQRRSVPGATRSTSAMSMRSAPPPRSSSHRPGRSIGIYRRGRRRHLGGAVSERRPDGVLRRDGLRRHGARRRLQRLGGRAVRVRTTADRGRTWMAVRPERLPPALPRRARLPPAAPTSRCSALTASGIGTSKSRVLRSTDGGRTWSVHATPVATGQATGIFSIAFRDASNGVVVGGNYQQEDDARDNLAGTDDGGRTWVRPSGAGL